LIKIHYFFRGAIGCDPYERPGMGLREFLERSHPCLPPGEDKRIAAQPFPYIALETVIPDPRV
jgi:hypothetical protein